MPALGLLLGLTPAAFTEEPVQARQEFALRITLRVYNYARVEQRELARARAEVERIFRDAEVAIGWTACPLAPEEAEANPVCRRELEPGEVVVRIQPRFSQAISASFRNVTLGYAPLQEGARGSYANIFYDRVEGLARGGEFSRGLILGHALAHEIAHLLLRTMTHSPNGLMSPHLDPDDLKLATVGRLLFSSEQAAHIRAEVRARREAASPLSLVAHDSTK